MASSRFENVYVKFKNPNDLEKLIWFGPNPDKILTAARHKEGLEIWMVKLFIIGLVCLFGLASPETRLPGPSDKHQLFSNTTRLRAVFVGSVCYEPITP